MRPFLPSYAESEEDKALREYIARSAPGARPPAAPAPAPAAPVAQATDTEVAPIAQPQPRPAPKPESNPFQDFLGGAGRFLVGALAGDGDIFVKQRERSKADPNSEASQAARTRMGPMLLALGLTQDEIGTLSAADLAQMSQGGSLVTGLATARGKAAQTRAAQEAARAAKLEDRDYSARQAVIDDERRGNTAGAKMDRATTMAGTAAQRQADAFAHSDLAQARAFGQAAALADRREDSAMSREERAAQREQARAARAARVEMEKEYAAAEAELDALEDKLEKRAADEALPGNENIATRTWVGVKSKIGGGTGRSSEDSILETDLDRAGNATFRITNGVANTQAEQEAAKRIFRGSGEAGSALQAIREQRKKIKKAQQARLAVLAAGGSAEDAQTAAARAAAAGGPPAAVSADEAELGIEVE